MGDIFSLLANMLLKSIPLNDIRIPPENIVQERVDRGQVDAAYSDPQPESVFVFPAARRLQDSAYRFRESCQSL